MNSRLSDRAATLDHGGKGRRGSGRRRPELPKQEPRFDERGADLGLGAGQLDRLGGGPHALPQLDADVENVLRQPAGEIGDERVGLPLVEDHHVDVGKRGLLPAAVAAVGHEGDPLAEVGGVAVRQGRPAPRRRSAEWPRRRAT